MDLIRAQAMAWVTNGANGGWGSQQWITPSNAHTLSINTIQSIQQQQQSINQSYMYTPNTLYKLNIPLTITPDSKHINHIDDVKLQHNHKHTLSTPHNKNDNNTDIQESNDDNTRDKVYSIISNAFQHQSTVQLQISADQLQNKHEIIQSTQNETQHNQLNQPDNSANSPPAPTSNLINPRLPNVSSGNNSMYNMPALNNMETISSDITTPITHQYTNRAAKYAGMSHLITPTNPHAVTNNTPSINSPFYSQINTNLWPPPRILAESSDMLQAATTSTYSVDYTLNVINDNSNKIRSSSHITYPQPTLHMSLPPVHQQLLPLYGTMYNTAQVLPSVVNINGILYSTPIQIPQYTQPYNMYLSPALTQSTQQITIPVQQPIQSPIVTANKQPDSHIYSPKPMLPPKNKPRRASTLDNNASPTKPRKSIKIESNNDITDSNDEIDNSNNKSPDMKDILRHLLDTSHSVVLPQTHINQAPVFVDSIQYNAIMKRKIIRAHSKPIIKSKHPSRQLHASRRQRGTGGKFKSKAELAAAGSDDVNQPRIHANTASITHLHTLASSN